MLLQILIDGIYSGSFLDNKINYKSIMHSIFRIESEDSIICGFYYITFIEYMIAGTTLLDYTNLLSNRKRMIRTYISI